MMAGSNEARLAAESRSTVLIKHQYIDVIVLSALGVGFAGDSPQGRIHFAHYNPECSDRTDGHGAIGENQSSRGRC